MVERQELISAIDSIADSALERGPIAGLSIAVMRGEDLLISAGYGVSDVDGGVPSTDHTLYDIASITKLFTAAAIMRLVESGRLRLDDDLATLLPAFPNRQQGGRITVEQILTHTSGLHDYEDADTSRRLAHFTPLTEEFVLDYLRDRRLDFEPGEAFSYSNTGFYLLGLIIERVTGRSFGAYLKEEIAGPLGLGDTGMCGDARQEGTMVRGYEVDGDALVAGKLYALGDLIGDGGLCSTASDLVRVPGALLRGGPLSAAALDRMTTPTSIATGIRVDYGFGVRLGEFEGHPLWGHTGGMGTYWSTLAYYPAEDVTLVVLVNTDGAREDALTIEGRVAQLVLGTGAPELKDLPVPPEERTMFSGRYEDGSGTVRIFERDGRLERALEGTGIGARELMYQGDGIFRRAEYPLDRIVFHVMNDRVQGFSEYYNGIFATYRRAANGS